MNPMLRVTILPLFLMLFLAGCVEETRPGRPKGEIGLIDDTVIKYNRALVKTESQEIDDFLSRYRWSMETSPTGLRYSIEKAGHGKQPQKGEVVWIKYKLRLLNGEQISSSDSAGPLKFSIGRGGVENGLEEGVMMLRCGDRARFIIPSHLAYGLLGDLDRIPERAVLVYEVELEKIARMTDSRNQSN